MRLLVLVLLFVAEAGRAASTAPVAAKNGMVVTAQEHATRIGVDVLQGRQCHRCGGGRRLRAGRGLSGGGQSRWRRLHDAAARRRAQDLHRLSRDRAARGDGDMYLDAKGNVIPDLSTRGHLAVACRARSPGWSTRARSTAPCRARADRARHHARRARLRARTGRRRHAARGHRRLPQGPGVGRDLSQSRPAIRSRRHVWCSATSRGPCAISACAAPTVSTRARPPPRWSRPAAPATESSRRRISMPTARELAAGGMRLPRVSRGVRAAAQLGWHRVVRDPQRARGLSTVRIRLGVGARRALRNRSDAPRLRRSQSPARRSGVREQPGRTAARPELRGESARASIRSAPAIRRSSSPASRRARACTPRTTRSRIASAMRSP